KAEDCASTRGKTRRGSACLLPLVEGDAAAGPGWQVHTRLSHVKDRDRRPALDEFDFSPGTPVIQRYPSTLLRAIVPVFVDLIEDLERRALDDIQDGIVMRVALVEVGRRALPHLRIEFVELKKQFIQAVAQGLNIQPDSPCFLRGDRVAVRWIAGIQCTA